MYNKCRISVFALFYIKLLITIMNSLLFVYWNLFIFFISLHHQLILQLLLLLFSMKPKLTNYFWVILQSTFFDDVTCFSISFCLCNFVMLLTHVHIPSSISGIFFSTVIKTWELLFQFFCTSSNMLLSLLFTFDLHSHFMWIHKTIEAFDIWTIRIVVLLSFWHWVLIIATILPFLPMADCIIPLTHAHLRVFFLSIFFIYAFWKVSLH